MAYGRLDIFWPDGNYETHQLSADNISVGRSTGNTISLETDTISRYHLNIMRADDGIFISDLDSANGTYLDGVRLQGNQPRQLMGGEEIQIGHLRMIYHLADDAPTMPVSAVEVEDDTQRIEREEADFRVEVYGPDIPVAPGAHIPAELTITNLSQHEQTFLVEASGVPREWMRIDRPKLLIDANESAQVLINFKPARVSTTKPGDYPVRVVVRQQENPDLILEAIITLRVLAYNGFGIALQSHRIEREENFRLHIHNQGSANLPVTISGRSKEPLEFRINPSQVTLAPGQRLLVQGTVRSPKRPLLGEAREHSFDLIAQSRTPSAFLLATRGTLVEKPLLPLWLAITVVGIGFSMVVILLLALSALLATPAPQPEIANFSLSDTQVARGETISLQWTVENAESINVYANNEQLGAAIDPARTDVSIDTSALNGNVVVRIEAINGDQTDSAEQILTVYEPLQVVRFEAAPLQIVRFTVQTLTVSWDVLGATSARIDGLSAFTSEPLPSAADAALNSFSPQGSVIINGIALDVFTLTLYAQNEYGDTVTTAQTINVINPTCTPLNAATTTLHEGPGFEYQVVGQLQNAEPIVVDARDASSTWLRLIISGGTGAWASRALFACAENFTVEDLRIELPVPGVAPQASVTPPAVSTNQPPPPVTGRPASTPLPPAPQTPVGTPLPTATPHR